MSLSDPLMTTEEVAELTRIPKGTLRYWRSINYGPPSFKVGPRRVAYRQSAVSNWLEAQESNTGTGAA